MERKHTNTFGPSPPLTLEQWQPVVIIWRLSNFHYNGILLIQIPPTVTLYDQVKRIVSGVAMTRISEGTYSYSYTTTSGSPAGTWKQYSLPMLILERLFRK